MSSGNLESVNLKNSNLSDSSAALPTQHLTEFSNDVEQTTQQLNTQ